MNNIELSLINGLNACRGKKGSWKLFSNPIINPNMELKREKEKKLYEVVCSYLENESNKSFSTLPISKFKSLLLQWDNEKVFEKVSTLVTETDLDKVLKFWYKENFLGLGDRCYCLAMNEHDTKNVYIVNVSKSCGIYKFKQEKEEEKEEETMDDESKILLQISNLLNEVYGLSKNLDSVVRANIVKEFNSTMKLDAQKVEKKSNKKSA